MTVLVFNVAAFRLAFPAFANATTYPDATLQGFWDVAALYVSTEADYGRLVDDARARALDLLTAHLTALSALIVAGRTPGIVQSSTIDKISVSLVPPPIKSDFDFWLQQTPYGLQLLALLGVHSVGGWYVPATNINARGMR
jgi:hypothetical protein